MSRVTASNVLSVNIVANALNRAWAFISAFAFVPLFIRLIGVEGYGVIGFYYALSTFLVIADLGFSATLNRQLARLAAASPSVRMGGDYVLSFERVYAPIGAVVALTVWLNAPAIATRWLQLSTLPVGEVTTSIQWMGVAIGLQLQASLYHGGLMGLERQAAADAIQIGASLLRNLGAVLVLWKVSPSVSAFAEWQAFANGVGLLVVRTTLMSALKSPGQSPPPEFSWAPIRESLHYVSGMASMAVLSVILTQADKLVASKLLSLEKFGLYAIASSVAMVPMMLATPISSAIIPRATGLIAIHNRHKLAVLYHQGAQLISLAILPASVVLLAFTEEVIGLWTGRMAEAELIGPSARLLLAGQVIQAIGLMPYCLTLGYGVVALNVRFAVVSVAILVPLSYVLFLRIGLLGGGVAWIAMNLLTVPFYCFLVHRRLLPDDFSRWIKQDVGRALVVAALIAGACRMFVVVPAGWLGGGVVLGTVWLVASLALALLLPAVRTLIRTRFPSFPA